MTHWWQYLLMFYYLGLSAVVLVLLGWDKLAACRGWWRQPERRLLVMGALAGGLAGFAGMLLFRHKIRKPLFWLVYLVAFFGHLFVWYWVARFLWL